MISLPEVAKYPHPEGTLATSRARAELTGADAVIDTLVSLDAHRLWQLVAAPAR